MVVALAARFAVNADDEAVLKKAFTHRQVEVGFVCRVSARIVAVVAFQTKIQLYKLDILISYVVELPRDCIADTALRIQHIRAYAQVFRYEAVKQNQTESLFVHAVLILLQAGECRVDFIVHIVPVFVRIQNIRRDIGFLQSPRYR